jgi:putative intracellular protease/amidase
LDAPAVVDGNLVTSRNPGDIPAFNEAMLASFAAHLDRRPQPTGTLTA